MPQAQKARNGQAARKPLTFIYAFALALFALQTPLFAQNRVFEEMPDNLIGRITVINLALPVQTSFDIAVIETNAPSYLAADKTERYYRLNRLIELEEELLKPTPDLRRYWYDLLQAKAPELTESDIDAIARDWWRANGFRAVKHDERYGLRDATFKEVREHLQLLRTGNEAQVIAAKEWLVMAHMAGCWESLAIPPQMHGLSPLAHLLARDISEESRIYAGPEDVKLRKTLKSLLAGKFTVEGDAGTAHPVSETDVDALLDALASGDADSKATSRRCLEDWLKQAIDAVLNKSAAENFHLSHPGARH